MGEGVGEGVLVGAGVITAGEGVAAALLERDEEKYSNSLSPPRPESPLAIKIIKRKMARSFFMSILYSRKIISNI